MKKLLCAALLVLAAAALAVSGSDALAQAELPQTEPGPLWTYITQTNPYTGWRMWPGKQAFYPGTRPHGALLTTYVNDTAFKAIEGGQKSLLPGSIIVKENYSPQKELMAITTMYKVIGYDPPHNNWFWVKYQPDGEVADYIWTQPLGAER
jgi:hypothetical protein